MEKHASVCSWSMVSVSVSCSMNLRGLFSFNLKSVQIPEFLRTNKQKITHEFIDSVSGVDVKPSSVPVSFV